MNGSKKHEGFEGEKLIVLPRNFLQQVSEHPLVNPLYITDIGFFPDAQFHYRERPSGSEQHILIYCEKGKGFVEFPEKTRPIEEGAFFVIPKNTPHIYGSDEKKPWTIYWVHFLGRNAEHYFANMKAAGYIAPVSLEKSYKIKFLFEDIFSFLKNGYTLDTMIYTSQVLANLLGVFFFINNDYMLGLKGDAVRIEETIMYMANNVELPLTLKELAAMANLSVTHYSYLFKKKTGFPPIDYFIRLKIQKACQLIDTTDLRINEIASKVGFKDPYYFSRAFHKIVQMSPTEYRAIKKG